MSKAVPLFILSIALAGCAPRADERATDRTLEAIITDAEAIDAAGITPNPVDPFELHEPPYKGPVVGAPPPE